jgi:flagellar hook-basal body complex protein FliE
MTIPAIGGIQSVAPTGYIGSTQATSATDGSGFGSVLAGVVDNTQALQATSNDLAIKAVTGDLTDIHQATIAATRAQVTMELVSAVRNKGIDAFNEIMRMQA